MKVVLLGTVALVLLSVEAVVVKSFGFQVTRIDVGLALVVYAAYHASTVNGVLSAFVVGYLLDVFTGRPTGLFPFLSVLIFLAVRASGQLIDGRVKSTALLVVALAAFAHSVLALAFTALTAPPGGAQVMTLSGVPLQVLLTTVAGYLLWPLLRRIEPGERPEPEGLL